jgi:cytochrome c biogenesis protein CcmG, thiol:disulfide interchange protein DsbE
MYTTAVVAALVALLGVGTFIALGTGPAVPVASPDGGDGPQVRLAGPDVFTGETVDIADFAGRPVVINIWANWCPGCHVEAKDIAAFAAANPDITVVGLNFQDTPGGAREFYDRHGWELVSIADRDGRLASGLRLQGMPTTIFLDSEHREAARITGETDLAGLEEGLAQATG